MSVTFEIPMSLLGYSFLYRLSLHGCDLLNVRFGSKAAAGQCPMYVCFRLETGPPNSQWSIPLGAISGLTDLGTTYIGSPAFR
jgi:hypothetical protein